MGKSQLRPGDTVRSGGVTGTVLRVVTTPVIDTLGRLQRHDLYVFVDWGNPYGAERAGR